MKISSYGAITKIKSIIFSNRLQGIGDYGLRDALLVAYKIIQLKGFGPIFSYLKYIIVPKESVVKTLPFEMVCYVTSKCNLQCSYCCFGISEQSLLRRMDGFQEILEGRDMTIDNFKRLAALPVFKNAVALVLSGGEPLLNVDFFKIVNYAKDKFPLIHLTTNGTLLDIFFEEILNSPLTHINISMDASSPEDYEKMRRCDGGRELFNKITESVKRLVKEKQRRKKNLRILLSFVVGKMNYKKIEEMVKFSENVGADAINLQNVCGFNCKELSRETLMSGDEAVKKVIGQIRARNTKIHIIYPKICSSDKSIRGCRQCFDAMTVNAEGDVGPCSVIVPRRNSIYGNVFDDTNIWNSEFYQKLRKPLLDKDAPLASSYCEDCTFLHSDFF